MLVLLCPGQGSQTPGFLTPWLELPGVGERIERLSTAAGTDLVAHGTTSDADTIRDTAVAQPLIVASGLACLAALSDDTTDLTATVGAVAGHSVGEITAAAVAGVVTDEQAVALVRERGRAMAQASAVTPTGMSAVLGGDAEEVLATLERHGLTPANMNGAGQVVAAGTLEQLAALKDDPPARARVMPLQVAGAFHTEHMAPAVAALAEHARTITPHDPRTALLSNRDGAVVTDGAEALSRIVAQVSSPVRWDLCQQTLADRGVTAVLEIPPAGALAGLAKRALPGVEVLALKSPDQLDAARDLLARHGAAGSAASTSDLESTGSSS